MPGRPLTNRSNFLVDKAHRPLHEAARTAAYRFRGMDVGDYISIGWLRVVRKLSPSEVEKIGPTFIFYNCLQAMRQEWSKSWSKHRHKRPLSDSLEGLQEGVEEEPLTDMMAQEYLGMLKPCERRIVRMVLWNQMTWSDIGAALGVSGTTAKARYNRIIDKLRRRAQV